MSLFRAYDIRGVFGEDLTEDIAEKIGRAFATYIGGGRIAVGRDVRLSSPELRNALVGGIMSSGCDVLDIGVVPTPTLYYASHKFKTEGAIMITGSHNPPCYNGFKMCRGTATLSGPEIQEIKKIVDSEGFNSGSGRLETVGIIPDYLAEIKKRAFIKKPLKIVIDAGNGTAGEIAPGLFQELGCRVTKLYCEPDGNFPNHPADPTVDAYLGDLVKKVKKTKADIGMAYDGDSDRLGVVDEKGGIIRGDQLLALFSREILKKGPAKIIFEVKCSHGLIEDIKAHGGTPIMYRTGHSFIKKKMKEEGAVLAGEMSGHFFFADNWFGFDDGIFASVRLAEILSSSSMTLSEIAATIPKYYSTPEIRVHVDDKEKFKIVDEVAGYFKKRYETITVDGVRIQFADGWGLVRASNTEPALILRFEAKTKKRLKEIKKIVADKLAEFRLNF
ncbi:MAG: phosphomannomutase [Candidatus Altiarchaeales archaeon IMC4]|nr:MAG: phosphomannomutase [Candidatus Altiarchaeales archaeon IMC4]